VRAAVTGQAEDADDEIHCGGYSALREECIRRRSGSPFAANEAGHRRRRTGKGRHWAGAEDTRPN
jgi:hypothetical protein